MGMEMGKGDNLSRVLLMHRNLPGLEDLRANLALTGWRLLEVQEEVDALAAAHRKDVKAVVLHCPPGEMVDMDFASVLRRVSPSGYLPVVIVVADSGERTRCAFLESGADDIVTPTTTPLELAARIRALLRFKAVHDKLADSQAALTEALQRERKLMEKLRRDNEHLQHLATTDPLTHCQNVRSFREVLDHEFKAARRYDHPLSLLMLDVDHFKVVNDTHGHPSGDYVLKELAVIFRNAIRESDLVARTGGEEFSVLLPQADARQARQFAERIRREVYAHRFNVYGRDIHVTVSLGLASYPSDAEITAPEMLVHFADQALLTAKDTGRDRVVAFSDLSDTVRLRLRRQCLAEADNPQPPAGSQQEIIV